MKVRKAVILFFSALLLCVLTTVGLTLFLDNLTIRGFSDAATWVAGGCLALGALAKGSANRNKNDPVYNQIARSLAMNRDAYEKAENENNSNSIAFGWVLITAAVIWGIFALVIYLIFH